MPHEVVQDALGHALGAQVTTVELLVPPLDPARLRGHAVYEAEGVHLLGVAKGEPGQDVRTGTNAEAYYGPQVEVTHYEQQLIRKLLHGRIDVAVEE